MCKVTRIRPDRYFDSVTLNVKLYQTKKDIPFCMNEDFLKVRLGLRGPTKDELIDYYELVDEKVINKDDVLKINTKEFADLSLEQMASSIIDKHTTDISTVNELLEKMFYDYNEGDTDIFKRNYSMSVGDIIKVNDAVFMCDSNGFKNLYGVLDL